MQEILSMNYEWLRAFHIISVIAWMAGMLYLPRLFVYHVDAEIGSDKSEAFKVMERRLLKIIINPAMIAALIFGILMFVANPALLSEAWMHMKFTALFLMFGVHGVLAKNVKRFAADQNIKSTKYFRIVNEVPTVLMVIIVIMAVAEPF